MDENCYILLVAYVVVQMMLGLQNVKYKMVSRQ